MTCKPVATCIHCVSCWSADWEGAEGSFLLFVPIIIKGVCRSVSHLTPEYLSYSYVHRFYAGILPVLSGSGFVSPRVFLVYSYTVKLGSLNWFIIKMTRSEDI